MNFQHPVLHFYCLRLQYRWPFTWSGNLVSLLTQKNYKKKIRQIFHNAKPSKSNNKNIGSPTGASYCHLQFQRKNMKPVISQSPIVAGWCANNNNTAIKIQILVQCCNPNTQSSQVFRWVAFHFFFLFLPGVFISILLFFYLMYEFTWFMKKD